MSSFSIERRYSLNDKFIARVYFVFVVLYVFLSGFVFIEPSPAEIMFTIMAPMMLIGFSTTWRIMILFLLLFVPMTISAYFGIIQGFFNLRFFTIDTYLFIFFFVLSSLGFHVKKIVNKDHLLSSLMKAWAVAGAVNIMAGLFAYVTGRTTLLGTEIIRFGIRLKGFFKDPNVLGPFLIPAGIYYLYMFFKEREKSIQHLLLFIFFSGGVILTFSRAAWLNLFFSMLFLIFGLIGEPRSRGKIAGFFVIVLILLMIFFQVSTQINILGVNLYDFFINRTGLKSYDTGRFSAQKEFVDIMNYSVLSLFFGVGPGNYENFSRMATHSLFARYIGERGLIGISTFVVFLVLVSRYALKSSYRKFFIPVLIGQLVNSFFIDSLHWRHLWLLIVISIL
ncbi:O-antigen ligase [Thermotoga sp. KOL6]|uniref:O-antigen ligase family protein n=1 Tax=Thermotoga sp. KOL6 TaxID=126741 RepID=UPI001E4CF639|nr:O-antigen ligase family protein [Thermotoga sp. KOL6]